MQLLNRHQRMPKEKLNNRGFSLVELLVIVGIMGVMLGIISLSVSLIKRSNVDKAVNIVKEAMNECRHKAMTNAAKEWKVVISSDRVEVVKVTSAGDESVYSTDKLPARIDFYVSEIKNQLSGTSVKNDYQSVSISYSINGEVRNVYFGGSPANTIKSQNGTAMYIMGRYKDKKQKTLKLYYFTGKNTVE